MAYNGMLYSRVMIGRRSEILASSCSDSAILKPVNERQTSFIL